MRLTKRWFALLVAALVTVATAALGLITSSVAAQASTTQNYEVTLYGWPDNSPPGNAIAYPVIHSVASGTGTYSDPITYATDRNELSPGTIVYYPYLHRYFIMEDDCVACDSDWNNGVRHIDLWVGGQGGNSSAVINCEDNLTQGSSPVIVSPPNNEPVDTTPLFNSSTNTCYNPSSFNGGGGGGGGGGGATGQITGYQGLCLDDRSASTALFNPIQVYTCNGTNAQQWTVTSNNTLQVLGMCLDVNGAGTANGTKVDLYTCNGTGAQTWTPGANGSLVNSNSGKCLDDTGWGGSGTQVQIWSCSGGANQSWTLP
jgi:Ricin-type beta-trefoil lectin domain